MARPLASGKQSVNLAPGEVRVSKIRREPPPKLKEVVVREPDERDREDALIGIVAFALAIFVILLAIAAWSGWSPAHYTVEM